jgi:hypothetical protein
MLPIYKPPSEQQIADRALRADVAAAEAELAHTFEAIENEVARMVDGLRELRKQALKKWFAGDRTGATYYSRLLQRAKGLHRRLRSVARLRGES